ncbi:hypothetical protein F442_09854 [Phytophthora nicotianae P10297]|uniref:Uncharacterized protein n=4 Tax=Phytophthora nicotianae TaxID=4792 RepID=W2R6Z0_PHYN3|nr:hypothetical protein PPTG_21053 [Phytophthora nicotianae INRA-310]ETI45528.1 hypothetical protein F443_09950 [Phytophthora nicotianae P1569]ETL38881.1 hypothetical protein L916_09651 [Phytophthora nicotianae]ETN21178.1 hypothetical protein PPTG_21053 [Phytophthora nicotianae INRA-310]ETP43385.1 hypothetical protein F442_09854 [Phytophthora nicotianae P10297]
MFQVGQTLKGLEPFDSDPGDGRLDDHLDLVDLTSQMPFLRAEVRAAQELGR